jgi:signal transduction histidine kinase/CheY-like chemotaxis protein/HAMP domain-containing protein
MFRFGLKQKVYLLILLSFVLLTVLFIAIYIPFQNRISSATLERNTLLVRTLIERDKDDIANNIFDSSLRATQMRLKDMMTVGGVSNISVHDDKGDIIAREGLLEDSSQLLLSESVLGAGGIAVDVVHWDEHTMLRYIYEIKAVGERMGFVQVYYLLDDMVRQKQQSFIFFFFFLTSTLVALGFVVNYVMGRTVIRPIITLRDLMQKIQAGDFNQRMDVDRVDEIGDLASTFNDMANDLHASYSEIERKGEQIRSMRTYLKNIIDAMSSMVISVDQNRNITELNQAAVEYMNLQEVTALGCNICDFIPQFKQFRSQVDSVIHGGVPAELYRQKLTEAGEEQFNIFIYPLSDGVVGAVVRIDDVSELHKKDEQLKQAQKMETIGTLAGGIAHDFNNILAGIVGTASLLKYAISSNRLDKGMLVERVDTIEKSASRAAELVNQLLLLSSKQRVTLQVMDLNESLHHVVNIAHNSFDKSIEINVQYTIDTAMISADPAQIEQILLNFCVNASHAMTSMRSEHSSWGGLLTIAVDIFEADELFSKYNSDARQGEYWCVSIQDTGVGMSSAVLEKIFDPFFTTKDHGSGTGLGLSVAYSIIRQHGGFVEVRSVPGKGTNFELYLPAVETGEELSVTPASDDVQIVYGSGTILIIDDEEIVRSIAKTILEEAGYTVLLAVNGEEGVRIYRENQQEIAGVLLDLVMPKMQGHEVFENIKVLNPEVKVLMASGFVNDERAQEALTMGVKGFIQKPYSLEGLSSAVAKLLHSWS